MRSKHGGKIAQHFALIYPTKVKTLTLVAIAAKFNPTSIIKSRKLMKYASVQDKFKVYSTALYSREFRRKLKKEDALYQTFYDDFAEDPTMFQDYVN
jgi:pimeloyl-ACP methyl ester carboxylesterase